MNDAITAVQNGMTRKELLELVEPEKVELILEACRDVRSFAMFDAVLKTGVNIAHNSVPFERLMLYGWIKELINERKT